VAITLVFIVLPTERTTSFFASLL